MGWNHKDCQSDLCAPAHTLKTDHGIDLSSRTRSVQGQSPLLVWLEGVLLVRCGLARRLQVGCFKVGKKFLLCLQGDSLEDYPKKVVVLEGLTSLVRPRGSLRWYVAKWIAFIGRGL
ncbi:unnamed protein product [Microthlaspi erraticum]|uniref:Uncharacterized protein n=1 Tax=Microthlaspi erraticum TaxID=1685480 RepID=A0A6D2K2S7_9BRAS|nr:unnamed protein product [Microthlaspi erraticum]